jgi:hypothetical protein
MLRTIRWESLTDEQIESFGVGFSRFDELLTVVTETLCAHPEMFPVLPGTRIRLCKTNEFAGNSFADIPSLAFYFHYDDVFVYVISVEVNETESYGRP